MKQGLDEIEVSALLRIGAETWQEEAQQEVLGLAERLLERGALAAAICGATPGLCSIHDKITGGLDMGIAQKYVDGLIKAYYENGGENNGIILRRQCMEQVRENCPALLRL